MMVLSKLDHGQTLVPHDVRAQGSELGGLRLPELLDRVFTAEVVTPHSSYGPHPKFCLWFFHGIYDFFTGRNPYWVT